MRTILHLDASVRGERSLSRKLSRHFVEEWRRRRPEYSVTYRDLGREPPSFVSEAWIAAVFTPEEERNPAQQDVVRLSDMLIDELAAADVIALGTPMYNYGMPAALKAWFDQVIRINKTFTFDLARGDFPLEPIMADKTLVMLTSHGEFGFEPGGIREARDNLMPHVRTCAHYLGVKDIHQISIEYQEFGGNRHEASIAAAYKAIGPLVEKLTSFDQAEAAAG
jgi:FMN-dependent NADH-azoreductase